MDNTIRNRLPVPAEEARSGRRYVWEIEKFFKCPIVGMCLTLGEQKQILKKARLICKDKTPFEIHEVMVVSLNSENQVSRRIDQLLRRKYGKQDEQLSRLEQPEFMQHFISVLEDGDFADALYAAAVSLKLSQDCKEYIFGEVHMAMHRHGEEVRKLKRNLARQEEELQKAVQRIKDEAQSRKSIQKENLALRRSLDDLAVKLAAAEKKTMAGTAVADTDDSATPSYPVTANQNPALRLEMLDKELENRDRELAALEAKNEWLLSKLKSQQEVNRHYQEEARAIIGEVTAMNQCDAACPSFDLCRKRILIVGGLTRMASLYREMIESRNGLFEYHDGYMKKGMKELESRLRRADIVLCPVNCNSHAACSAVKNLAKKHKKTVHMLANSSLNSISQVIWGGGTTPADVN